MALTRQGGQSEVDLHRDDNARIAASDLVTAYFDRQEDRSQRKDALVTRWGVGIANVRDPGDTDTDDTPLETYVKKDFELQVDEGMIDNVSSGFGFKVVNARATLFTERGMTFSLTTEGDKDVQRADELLNENREKGGFLPALVGADKKSIQCGSAAVMVDFSRGHLRYQKLTPGDITAHYNEYVEEEGKTRSVDISSIEDATCLIIRLGIVDTVNTKYLAIYGASDIYEYGRYCIFISKDGQPTVPAFDPSGIEAVDYVPQKGLGAGGPANPMSVYAAENPDQDVPEYPLIVLKSGITDDKSVPMPFSNSLYKDSIEFDLTASHLLITANDAARGTFAVYRELEAAGHSLPTTTVGPVAFPPGCTAEHISHDSQATLDALKVLKERMIDCAAGYAVPDHYIATEEKALNESSGIALAIKMEPLQKARTFRVNENKTGIFKLFEIEKAYIHMFAVEEGDAKDADISLLLECDQNWEPGEIVIPENRKEKTERIKAAKEAGLIDEIEAIRQENDLSSDEEAIALYEKYKERAKKFPPLKKDEVEQPFKKPGLMRRGQKSTQQPPQRGE